MENEMSLIDFNWDESTDLNNIFDGKENNEDFNQNDENDFVEDDNFDSEEDFEQKEEQKDSKNNKSKTDNKKTSSTKNKEEDSFEDEKEDFVEDSENTIYTDVFKDLKDYGIFKHVELQEGENLDAKRLSELYEEEYNAEVSSRIENWASKELDEEAQQFIAFKRNGGNTRDFLNRLKDLENSSFPEGDISDEEYQDEIIRLQLKEDDWDDDEIEERLENLTKNGKKESVAKKYLERFEKIKKQEIENITKKQEEARKEFIESQKEFRNEIKTKLESGKEILGFNISNKEKSELYNQLIDRNIEIKKGVFITPFQEKLAEAFKDTDKLIVLAKILNNNFDLSDLKKSIATQETRKIKSNLENRKGLKNSSFGSSTGGINLSKLFN